MSENNFDDNIRKKLESIQPEYDSSAWEKLRKSLPLPWYSSFLREFGGWIYGGLATAALLYTYNYNQTIKKENLLLNDKISTIQSSLNTNSEKDTVYVSNKEIDTVYLTKVIREKVFVGIENEPFITKSGKEESSSKSTIKTNSEKQELVSSTILKENSIKNSDPTDNQPRTLEKVVSNTTKPNENKEGEIKVTSEAISKISNDEKKEIENKEVKEVEKETQKIADLVIPEKEMPKDEIPEQKFKLKNINARFGIATDYSGNRASSVGPAIEIFMGEKISFNTGLFVTGKKEVEFKQPKDFNSLTGKQFEDRYIKYIGLRPQKIENIEITTSIVKLPLFINYYIPVKNNLAFLLTSGTKLDLSVVETVKYKAERVGGETFINKFESQHNPRVFNSLYYGMGIQYNYKRLFGQFSPYFEFPFGQSSFLVPPRRFGINGSLKFSLKK